MAPKFKVKYEETKDTLVQTCDLYRLDQSKIGYRICASALAITVFLIILAKSNCLTISTNEQIAFCLRYILIWVAIFIGLEIFRRTIGRKMAHTSAYGDGDAAYEERCEKRNGSLIVEMSFFEDHFLNDTQSKQKTYSYSDVSKIVESNTAIGIVVKTDIGAKGIYSFPKTAMEEGSIDELKSFLENACPSVKKIKVL